MSITVNEPIETYNQVGLGLTNYVETRKLSPILKWAGGKEQELKYILPNLPDKKFVNYYEPFVGGGAVYTAIQANKYFINDKSDELITLYRSLINGDRTIFFDVINEIISNWELIKPIIERNKNLLIKTYKNYRLDNITEKKFQDSLIGFVSTHKELYQKMLSSYLNFNNENFLSEIEKNLIRKGKRMKVIEKEKKLLPDQDILDNFETALKSAFYMQLRHIYNNTQEYELTNALKSAVFLFIRNYAYSGMFRYNSKGEFNVPYGGIGYNNKNFQKKINYLKSIELKSLLNNTTIVNEDFEIFLKKHKPTKDDFVFLDPPYDTEFSTYANNEFTKTDQERLANFLLYKCEARWMMIIKNTEFILNLYKHKHLNIKSFDKKYLVSFMNRNDKEVKHLLITNY